MVGNDAHGYVLLLVFTILGTSHGGDGVDERLEDVGVVVGRLALHGHTETLEAHTGIDYLGGQTFEAAVGLTVELHEHKVPYLDDLRMVVVHHVAAGYLLLFFFGTEVDVDFRARTAGTCIAHFPEVVMLVTVDDVVLRQELFPVGSSFIVAAQAFFGAAFEDGSVEVFGVDFQHVHQVFPGPGDGFLLEVVAERPVAQHLEHGVVIRVVSHFFQVVVLSADAQALL